MAMTNPLAPFNNKEQIQELHETVWIRLAPSKIHGIGVFAIRPIPKETYCIWPTYAVRPKMQFNLPIKMLKLIKPSIRKLILDRQMIGTATKNVSFQSPNADADHQAFMNHSTNPNTNGHTALRNIKQGEELTEDYTKLTHNKIHPIMRKHLKNII